MLMIVSLPICYGRSSKYYMPYRKACDVVSQEIYHRTRCFQSM